MPDGADYADDRMPRLVIFRRPKTNALTDRALVGPVLTRESLVDDRYVWGIFHVRVVEITSGEQRYSHRVKVTRSYNPVLNRRGLANRQHRKTFDCKTPSPAASP